MAFDFDTSTNFITQTDAEDDNFCHWTPIYSRKYSAGFSFSSLGESSANSSTSEFSTISSQTIDHRSPAELHPDIHFLELSLLKSPRDYHRNNDHNYAKPLEQSSNVSFASTSSADAITHNSNSNSDNDDGERRKSKRNGERKYRRKKKTSLNFDQMIKNIFGENERILNESFNSSISMKSIYDDDDDDDDESESNKPNILPTFDAGHFDCGKRRLRVCKRVEHEPHQWRTPDLPPFKRARLHHHHH